jgi:uncharacterized protein (TIGR00255 family)
VDVTVNVLSSAEEDAAVTVNTAAAAQYVKGLRELEESFGVEGGISLGLLAGLPDVFRPVTGDIDEEAAIAVLTAATEEAVVSLNGMRIAEGVKLAEDIVARAGAIERAAAGISELTGELTLAYAEKLRTRIAEILEKSGGGELPEDRIAAEAALYADKSDVTEEIVRLRSHLEQLRSLLTEDAAEPVGKKLDFLVQEMNREANTIASKASDLEVTRLMLGVKNEVEKIREQVQNIE